MSINNIPIELKERAQWVGSDSKGAPINPATGYHARADDKNTWGEFHDACQCGTRHIAFIFTADDPYTVIDLDTYDVPEHAGIHARIVQSLDSYTEHSKSGMGTHIVVRGSIPRGVKNKNKGVEIYSATKAMTLTGDVYGCAVINDRQQILDALFDEFAISNDSSEIVSSEPDFFTDDEILSRIRNSGQAEKFNALFNKNNAYLVEHYNSGVNKFDHSSVDSALISMLCYWSKSDDQVSRIFRTSKLYRPEKGKNGTDGEDYIRRTMRRARGFRAQQAQQSLEQALEVANNLKTTQPTVEKVSVNTDEPPGLIGELQKYFYYRSVRPVYEVSLGAAIGFVAGVAGRQFNISATGLNHYIMVLGGTGIGKEEGPKGINSITAKVKELEKDVEKYVGPADFSSGTGLLGSLVKEPCFLSIVGEIGVRLQEISGKNTSDANKSLLRILLGLFNKSGRDQYESGKVYAKAKDNVAGIHSPAPTILGDSTPETFYTALTEHDIETGLIPRFTILEYTGGRPPRNKISANAQPDTALVRKVTRLVRKCIKMEKNNSVQDILLDQKATALLDEFDEYCDDKINSGDGVSRHLWTRAHLKALRMAGLLAVGNLQDNEAPRVTKREAEWSINFVKQEVRNILRRFDEGEVGEGERVQESLVRQAVTEAFTQRKQTKLLNQTMIDNKCVPYAFLRQKLRRQQAFYGSKRGATSAIKAALADLVEADILVKLDSAEAHEKFDTRSALYAPGRNW